MFEHPMTRKIAGFLQQIGLKIEAEELEEGTFLPGILIRSGVMIVDETRLKYPGDLLHEAGHLALAPPELRPFLDDKVELPGFDMNKVEAGTIAWSYAAGLHIGLQPEDVFHAGYAREGLSGLLTNYSLGVYLGANVLEESGMAVSGRTAAGLPGIEPYPKMLKWVRN
jgi:hypothetical protein